MNQKLKGSQEPPYTPGIRLYRFLLFISNLIYVYYYIYKYKYKYKYKYRDRDSSYSDECEAVNGEMEVGGKKNRNTYFPMEVETFIHSSPYLTIS